MPRSQKQTKPRFTRRGAARQDGVEEEENGRGAEGKAAEGKRKQSNPISSFFFFFFEKKKKKVNHVW
jgi:hypothetical protein